jgi:multiple sugar transport system substrate-binding protein
MGSSRRWTRGAWPAGLLVGVTLIAAGCGGDDSGDANEGGDGSAPATITFWGRAANQEINQRLVDAYNKTHDTKVEFTAFPDDQFVTRVGTAASSGDGPDLLAVDSVYMPQFIDQGLLADVTDRARALEFYDQLSKGQMDVSTADDRVYAVPRDVDASTLFWNKKLFRQAGLDPEQPPRSFAEIEEYARKITALGGSKRGFYFAGRCSGCNAYTLLPLVWASGGEVLDDQGAPSFESPAVKEALSLYNRLWESGSVPKSARTDGGENWLTPFTAGNIGMQPLGAFAIRAIREQNPDLDFGVARLPGATGGEAAFNGGDVIGIAAQSENADAAWEFIEWTLSEETQVGVVANDGGLVARADLVENEHAEGDAQVLASNQALEVGRTPKSTVYNQLFNDPNGPFPTAFTKAVFGGDVDGAVAEAQSAGTEIFDQGS